MFRRITILIVAASLPFLCGQTLAANAISVSKIDGLDSSRGLMTGLPIRYYIHFQIGEDTVTIVSNAFRIYSPDDASWQPPIMVETAPLSIYFNSLIPGFFFFYFTADGMGADTIGFAAASFNFYPGLEPGFSNDLFFIETMLTEEQIGKTLCLDSTYSEDYQIGWLWAATGVGELVPEWDGPHCYEIVDCCVGSRGDVNGDGVGPNILDLVRLVDYLFRGATAPDCQLESDVNGDGMPYNILDLTFVVDFVFRSGQPAPACPN